MNADDIDDAGGHFDNDMRRVFSPGCTINNIRNGSGQRSDTVYANLVAPDGSLIISATLSYINEQLTRARIADA